MKSTTRQSIVVPLQGDRLYLEHVPRAALRCALGFGVEAFQASKTRNLCGRVSYDNNGLALSVNDLQECNVDLVFMKVIDPSRWLNDLAA